MYRHFFVHLSQRAFVVLHKILDKFLRLAHVGEHGLDLGDNIVAALYLKLFDDVLLGLVVHTQLVEQAVGQEDLVCGDELVATVQAAEELDEVVDLALDVCHALLLEGVPLCVVTIKSYVVRRLVELVHENSKRFVTRFLEVHVLREAVTDNRVYLRLEVKQGPDHVERVLSVVLVVDNFRSHVLDVRLHLVDNVFETILRLDLDEHIVNQSQLGQLVLNKLRAHSLVQLGDLLGEISNALGEHNLDDLVLREHLEEDVSVVTFLLQRMLRVQYILVAGLTLAPVL